MSTKTITGIYAIRYRFLGWIISVTATANLFGRILLQIAILYIRHMMMKNKRSKVYTNVEVLEMMDANVIQFKPNRAARI